MVGMAELVAKLKAVLASRPKHVLEDVAKRKLEDRASYFGSEITNFLESELGSSVLGLLKQRKSWICFSDHCFLNSNGLRYHPNSDCYPDDVKPSTAYDAAEAAIRDSINDPFRYLIEKMIELINKEP